MFSYKGSGINLYRVYLWLADLRLVFTPNRQNDKNGEEAAGFGGGKFFHDTTSKVGDL